MNKDKADQLIVKYSQKIFGFAMKKAFSYDEAEELSGEMLKEVYLSFLKNQEIVNKVKLKIACAIFLTLCYFSPAVSGIIEKELNTPFDFSDQPSKTEAHWTRDKNVRDVQKKPRRCHKAH